MTEAPQKCVDDQIYVPGSWRCPKCEFVLQQFNLHASTGAVTVNDEPGEKCPNCNSPLWRVSWREDAITMSKRCEEEMTRAIKAESELAALKATIEQIKLHVLPPDSGFHTAPWRRNLIYDRLVEVLYPRARA